MTASRNVKGFDSAFNSKTANLTSDLDWGPLDPNNITTSEKRIKEGLNVNTLAMRVLTMKFIMMTIMLLFHKASTNKFP